MGSNFSLATINPNHYLVLAAQEGKPQTPSQTSSGAAGGDLRAEQQAIVTRMSRSATSDDARIAMESMAKALGLN